MLSVITSIISSVLGLVLNKARNTAADKLKQRGDVTDEKLRNVIVEDLNDIKTKIDGLARKDLLASYSFLKEGIVTLNAVLDEAKDEQTSEDEVKADQDGGSKTTDTATGNESESEVLSEVIELSNAIQKLNNTSNGRLIDAKECFKAAREKATEAFCNEALSLPDRIMATKLRVVSKILECLHNTKVAVAGCMLFLEELHNLPAIGETFSTYFKGGIKSVLFQDWRLENVKSVLSLNFDISEFVTRFSGELPNVRNWPRIHLSTRGETIHPLVIDRYVVNKITDKKTFLPENYVITHTMQSHICAVNSKGELLYFDQISINTINRSGCRKTFCDLLRQATLNRIGACMGVTALAIDRYDNVYVIINYDGCLNYEDGHVLFVFDSSGNKKHERSLRFLEKEWRFTNCVVNNDGEVLIHVISKDIIYVCDSTGTFKSCLPLDHDSSFHPTLNSIELQCVTNQNEIIMSMGKDVLVYTKEGKLKRKITVQDDIRRVAYNYQTSNIEILVKRRRSLSFILSYLENDEVERLYLSTNWLLSFPFFSYHPAGPGALTISLIFFLRTISSTIIFM